jgi:hypothetical protein
MADYHPLITRAVEGLANSTAEARRTLYERARAALVAQLRGIDPPLSEAEITRERLALEDAIRKVEAESVRKARSEPRPAAPHSIQTTTRPYGGSTPSLSSSPALRDRAGGSPASASPARPETRLPDAPRNEAPSSGGTREALPREAARGESPASARSRLLGARSAQRPREEFKGFRQYGRGAGDPDGSAGISPGRDEYDTHGAAASTPQFSDAQDDAWHSRAAERIDDEQAAAVLEDTAPVHEFDQTYDFDDQDQIEPGRPPAHRPIEPVERYREPRPPRSYRGLLRLAAVLIVLAAVGATVAWQWSNINTLYQFLAHMRSRPTQTAQPPAGEPKFGGRVPQEQNRQPPVAATPRGQSGPAVAQRVVLYEEDSSNPQGKQYIGSAVWRTETVSPGGGLAPEVQIRADVTVPERNMTVTWTLRRNTDQALPASHTIEIMFNLPADFAGGGIANVPGVLMKESEQARGVPLAGLAVKVTNGFFLIGLSAVDADVQRNLQLLKDRPWFDVPIVYNNGGRAILALEKGPSGERAFADAFAAWGK